MDFIHFNLYFAIMNPIINLHLYHHTSKYLRLRKIKEDAKVGKWDIIVFMIYIAFITRAKQSHTNLNNFILYAFLNIKI